MGFRGTKKGNREKTEQLVVSATVTLKYTLLGSINCREFCIRLLDAINQVNQKRTTVLTLF